MDILLTDVQKWYAIKINKTVEELDSYDLFCAKVAYDYHTEQCNIDNVVGRSEQLVAFLKWVGDGYDFENNAEKIVREYIDEGN